MAIVLSTPPFTVFFDDDGNPLNGGLVYTYTAGTLNARATYTDQGGLTQNANPVVLDSSGRASIWLDNTASYKFIIKTSAGTTLSNGTQDNIAPFSNASGLSILGNIDANSILGNNTGAPTSPLALTVAQVRTLLSLTAATPITNSLAGDVALNNTSNFFDGPSVAQGTSGTWFASGTVTLVDTVGTAGFYVKLWDGTTVIASALHEQNGSTNYITVALSGYITSPAANIRISARDITSTSGKIIFNGTGTSKDSTLSAIRINY